MKSKHSFLYRNGLSIVLVLFFIVSMVGQVITGLHEYNEEREQYQMAAVSIGQYFSTGHFYQTTFENWESEFLQMAMYVLLTVWLRQKGSSESKKLDEKEEVDMEPDPNKNGAPWPVRRGGFILAIYRNSLSIAFGVLFLISFAIHASGTTTKSKHSKVNLRCLLGSLCTWRDSGLSRSRIGKVNLSL